MSFVHPDFANSMREGQEWIEQKDKTKLLEPRNKLWILDCREKFKTMCIKGILAQCLGPVSCLIQVQEAMRLVHIDHIRKRVGEQEKKEVAKKQQSWINSDVSQSDLTIRQQMAAQEFSQEEERSMAPLHDSNCTEDLPEGGHVNDEFPCTNSTTKEEDQEGCCCISPKRTQEAYTI